MIKFMIFVGIFCLMVLLSAFMLVCAIYAKKQDDTYKLFPFAIAMICMILVFLLEIHSLIFMEKSIIGETK